MSVKSKAHENKRKQNVTLNKNLKPCATLPVFVCNCLQLCLEAVHNPAALCVSAGMSVVQCAAIALKATVCEVESNKSLGNSKVHTLRREQMMETLECVLQMCSYLHVMVSLRVTMKHTLLQHYPYIVSSDLLSQMTFAHLNSAHIFQDKLFCEATLNHKSIKK